MFGIFKRIKAKKEEMIRLYNEKVKEELITYINAYENQNSTMEAMHILIHELDLDIKMLMKKYNLVMDYDIFEDDDYYEIEICTSLDSKGDFYIAISTENGKNTLFLNDETELDTDKLTTEEIINKIIDEIEKNHATI